MNIFIITGPSGIGKTHLIHELASLGVYPLEVYTDRDKRPSEKKNTDRVYLSKKEFSIAINDFLYWFEFQDNRYGYMKSDIKKQKKLGNSICFNIPPSFLPFILKKLPEAIVIYLNTKENNFPMLFDRMLKRDLFIHDSKHSKKAKIQKIKKRLNYAKEELKELAKIRKVVSQNPLNKIFNISSDATLYQKVIPYLKNLI